jgi:hypothetical protein
VKPSALASLRAWLAEPAPAAADMAAWRARALGLVLRSDLVAVAFGAAGTGLFAQRRAALFGIQAATLALVLVALRVARRRPRLAAGGFVGCLWLLGTALALLGNGTNGLVSAFYLGSTVLAGVLLGPWSAAILAVASTAAEFGLAAFATWGPARCTTSPCRRWRAGWGSCS